MPGPFHTTKDDCRRTLRHLELVAYSHAVSALRAQGPLREEVRQLLAGLRRALHIGVARHQAEARRASNDHLLAVVAEQLSGPNSELEWVQEGRREIPILPRMTPQTAYTIIADRAAVKAAEENKSIIQREKISRRPLSPGSVKSLSDTIEDDMDNIENTETEDEKCTKMKTDINLPPIVMTDQSLMVNDEGPPRKRSKQDSVSIPHRTSHQKHLNFSEIYTNFSKPHSGKLSHGRSSYSHSGKLHLKSNYSNLSKSHLKHRSLSKHTKHSGHGHITVSQNKLDSNISKSQTPTYQANYPQSIVQNVNIDESNTDLKVHSGAIILSESPTMQLLTQSVVSQDSSPHPSSLPLSSDEMSNSSVQGSSINTNSNVSPLNMLQHKSGKSCHVIFTKKPESPGESPTTQILQVSNKQSSSKCDVKFIPNKQLIVNPGNNYQKILDSSGKIITKIVQPITSKSIVQINNNIAQAHVTNAQVRDKVLIMPKSPVISSDVQKQPLKNISITPNNSSNNTKYGENTTIIKNNVDSPLKNVIVNNPDNKLTTKTYLFNSKSGQKMVVVDPNIAGSNVPVFKLDLNKAKSKTMKLITVSGQSLNNQSKANNMVLSSFRHINPYVINKSSNIISKDSLNQIKSSQINNENITKTLPQIQITNKNVKYSSTPKGNVIVVQGNAICKSAVTAKSGNDSITDPITVVNKIGSVAPQITPASTSAPQDSAINKITSDVVLLELNNDQSQQDENFNKCIEGNNSENILQENSKSEETLVNEDNSVVFHNQIGNDCNADSMESTTDSLLEASHAEENSKSGDSSSEIQQTQDTSDDNTITSRSTLRNFTNWESELTNNGTKSNSDKLSKLNLELEMSSDSDGDDREMYITSTEDINKDDKETSQDESQYDEQEDINDTYVQHSSINIPSRTLLNRLHDDGSSSNDSSFVLIKNLDSTRLELLESSQTSGSAME